MQPIKTIPLSFQAADEIRKNIITGGYAQGQKVTEEECAAALGLSRVCVREAFLKLQEEGLLVKQVNRCTTVAEFTKDDVKDIYYLRLSLEKMCSTLCFERGTLPVREMDESFARMTAMSQKPDIQPMDLLEEDFRFHAAIVNASGNTRAAKVWNDLQWQMLTVLFPVQAAYTLQHDLQHNVTQHKALIGALKTLDKGMCHPVLEAHILNSMDTLLTLY